MPKRTTKDRWLSKNYAKCYCFKRYGRVYLSVFSKRIATDILWTQANKYTALSMLDNEAEKTLAGELPIAPINTVNDLILKYSDVMFPDYKPYQILLRKRAIKYMITSNHNLSDVLAITEMIQANKQVLLKSYSEPYIFKIMQVIQQIFQFGVDEGFISRNPISTRILPSQGREARKVFFNDKELKILLSELDKYKMSELYHLVYIISQVGFRISEALSLKVKDVNIQSRMVSLKVSKTGSRYIPLSLFDVMDSFKVLIKDKSEDDYLFSYRTTQKLRDVLTQIMKKHGFKYPFKSFHSLRKYAITKFIHQGHIPQLGSQIFGHSLTIMIKHYVETLGEEEVQKLAKKSHNFVSDGKK